jgi:hypothetical protein
MKKVPLSCGARGGLFDGVNQESAYSRCCGAETDVCGGFLQAIGGGAKVRPNLRPARGS